LAFGFVGDAISATAVSRPGAPPSDDDDDDDVLFGLQPTTKSAPAAHL
jgi:hypothetical protein